MQKNKQNQSGGILVYVLIAVALFGSVLATFSKGSNISSSALDTSREKMIAIELIASSKAINNAVQKMLRNGCSENAISFENPHVTGYANSNSPNTGDKTCWVFNAAGGNVKWAKPDPHISTTTPFVYTANNIVVFDGDSQPFNDCTNDNSCADLVMMITAVPTTLCKEINRQLNIVADDDLPQLSNTVSLTKFTGSYAQSLKFAPTATGSTFIKPSAGFCASYSGNNIYAYVLNAR